MKEKIANRIFVVLGLLFCVGAFLSAQQGQVTVSTLVFGSGDKAYAYSDKVNLRDAPNTGGKVLKQLMTGDEATVKAMTPIRQTLYGLSDYWYKVAWAGQEGYIWGGLLAKSVGFVDIEGPHSQVRILEQISESYQDEVPIQISKDYFDKSFLPKFADPAAKKTMQRNYQASEGSDGKTLSLVVYNSDGTIDDDPGTDYPRQLIQGISVLLKSAGIAPISDSNDIFFKAFGVSGRILMKALTKNRQPWEFSYVYPRPSAADAAENLVDAYGIETPEEGSDSRYNEGFNNSGIDLFVDKGFTPSVILISFHANAQIDVLRFDQSSLFYFDGKGLSLVTSYTGGWRGGGSGGGTALIFPSDEGGEKNVLTFKSTEVESVTGISKLKWGGTSFKKMQ
jgi:hypothetical protein